MLHGDKAGIKEIMINDPIIELKNKEGESIMKDTLWGIIYFYALTLNKNVKDCKLYLNNKEVKEPEDIEE